jgi:hypothetical protein
MLGSVPGNRQTSIGRVLKYGLLGGAIGFGIGILWENRRLTQSIATGALRSMGKVRDEHWLECHPIDYA